MSNTEFIDTHVGEVIELAPFILDQPGAAQYVIGPPGCGKSEIAPKVAEAAGLLWDPKWIINDVGKGPQERQGYGIPEAKTRDMWFSAPEDLPTVDRVGDKPYLICVEELPNCDESVIALYHGIFNPDRDGHPTIGTHKLGKNIRFHFSGNSRKHGAPGAKVLSAPMITRLCTFSIKPNAQHWMNVWAPEQGFTPSIHYTSLYFTGGDGTDSVAVAQLNKVFAPPVPQPWDGWTFATPRGHAEVCRRTMPDSPLIKAIEEGTATYDQMQLVVQGFIGPDMAAETVSFARAMANVLGTVAQLKKNEIDFGTLPRREQYAAALGCYRVACREARKDPDAAVVSGSLDWFIDGVILNCSNELRSWIIKMATDESPLNGNKAPIPLQFHPKSEQIMGL